MKGCFAAIVAIFVIFQAVHSDTSKEKEDVVMVNGKLKPTMGQLKTIWARVNQEREKDREKFNLQTLLRLAFHQCVGTSCNGCVDPTDPENKGFEDVIQALNNLQKLPEVNTYMTMSDLIPFALIYLFQHGILQNNLECRQCHKCSTPTPNYEYWWGRPDGCANIYTKVEGTNPNGFPTMQMSRQEIFDFYKKDFNYTPAEAMVLTAGGHSSGKVHRNVSGFEGKLHAAKQYGRGFSNRVPSWLTNDEGPDLRYHANSPNSTTDKFYQVDAYSWSGGKIGMLFDSDILAVYDIKRNPLTDLQCKINDVIFHGKHEKPREPYPYPYCKKSDLYDLAKEYGNDPLKFVNDFFDIYHRMLNKGNEGKLHKLQVPPRKVKTMNNFCYIRVVNALCYTGADKDWANAQNASMTRYEEEFYTLLAKANRKIKKAKDALKDASNEDAEEVLEKAVITKRSAKEAIREARSKLQEAIDIMVETEDYHPSRDDRGKAKKIQKEGKKIAEAAIEDITKAVEMAKKVLKTLETLA